MKKKIIGIAAQITILVSCFYLISFLSSMASSMNGDPCIPTDHSQAKVNQLQGLYVFVDATPLQEYDYLGSVQNGMRLTGSSQYQPVRDRLIKKIKDQYPAADGIIFHFVNNAPDKADAIKFK